MSLAIQYNALSCFRFKVHLDPLETVQAEFLSLSMTL